MTTTVPTSPSEQSALEAFDKFLQNVWMDNRPDEALALWRYFTANSKEYAAEALAALDFVLANPPADLVERMQQKGWLFLAHDDTEETPFSRDEYLDWLRKMRADFS